MVAILKKTQTSDKVYLYIALSYTSISSFKILSYQLYEWL